METELLKKLEQQLDSFDPEARKAALEAIASGIGDGSIETQSCTDFVNLHAHTFFSYNCYGYSPSKFAWLARKQGFYAGGIVDFDVLDGVDEFLRAAGLMNLRACASIETRVFVPEFADLEINSPGEPGIAYHMGAAIPCGKLSPKAKKFLASIKSTAQSRNRQMIERLNGYLSPVMIDFDEDVLGLTPAGNATERHICLAFARKAAEFFKHGADELLKYWQIKLGTALSPQDLPETPKLLNAIRAKTMKQGGVGYVRPDAGAFPTMKQMNDFVVEAGGIPTVAWLNGLSEGEKKIEQLLAIAMMSGVAALNIVPDRNFTPGVVDQRVVELERIVHLCQKLGLPIMVGTEMNSFGQKFVDSFETDELKRLLPEFVKGARIFYAHTVLQQKAQLGYLSQWANYHLGDIRLKNDFYEIFGQTLRPSDIGRLKVSQDQSPQDILQLLKEL
ncbi:MAG: hypothetical protein LLF76_01790 [Planctomycetaceae bacterium]|nr:hypothetical protein [Planctomycetaceae bacterium]